jgi:hypothetical protein
MCPERKMIFGRIRVLVPSAASLHAMRLLFLFHLPCAPRTMMMPVLCGQSARNGTDHDEMRMRMPAQNDITTITSQRKMGMPAQSTIIITAQLETTMTTHAQNTTIIGRVKMRTMMILVPSGPTAKSGASQDVNVMTMIMLP